MTLNNLAADLSPLANTVIGLAVLLVIAATALLWPANTPEEQKEQP